MIFWEMRIECASFAEQTAGDCRLEFPMRHFLGHPVTNVVSSFPFFATICPVATDGASAKSRSSLDIVSRKHLADSSDSTLFRFVQKPFEVFDQIGIL